MCVCDGVALVATVDRGGIRGITGGGGGVRGVVGCIYLLPHIMVQCKHFVYTVQTEPKIFFS